MNHREPRRLPRSARQVWPGLLLLLIAPSHRADAHILPCLRMLVCSEYYYVRPPARDYLPALGPAPLRFAAKPPPLGPRPPAIVSDAEAPQESGEEPAAASEPPPADTANPPAESPVAATQPPAPPPPPEPEPILRDDLRPAVRPEEFLPYFEIPAGRRGAVLSVPVPFAPPGSSGPALPPSSATYTQSP